MMSSVVEEILPFDHLNINEFVHSKNKNIILAGAIYRTCLFNLGFALSMSFWESVFFLFFFAKILMNHLQTD